MFKIRLTLAIAATLGAAAPAVAATSVVYSTVPAGQAAFDATVTASGGTVSTQVLGTGASYPDFTISRSPSTTYSEITGRLVPIDPAGTIKGPNGNSRPSGVTFSFNTAVNAFGLNVADWGTCCLPSALYIAFDGGPAIQVGLADSANPALLTNGVAAIFVSAIDDSDTFTTVEFWGDGFGEALYAGGTIRYAAVDIGSLPGGVPEPGTWATMILGFGAMGAAIRRRKARTTVSFA